MNSVDAAWVAGIIEGEGTMVIDYRKSEKGNHSPRVFVSVAMTDKDVIEAIHSKTGLGTIYGPYKGGGTKGKEDWKVQWQWKVFRREEVYSILTTILPFLYERRSIQAIKCLDLIDELNAKAQYKKEFCPKGHSKPDCLEPDGRHCRNCRIEKYALRKEA